MVFRFIYFLLTYLLGLCAHLVKFDLRQEPINLIKQILQFCPIVAHITHLHFYTFYLCQLIITDGHLLHVHHTE